MTAFTEMALHYPPLRVYVLCKQGPELQILLVIPGHVVDVGQDAVEEAGHHAGAGAEVGHAAQHEAAALRHGETVRHHLEAGEAGLQDVEVGHLVIGHLHPCTRSTSTWRQTLSELVVFDDFKNLWLTHLLP